MTGPDLPDHDCFVMMCHDRLELASAQSAHWRREAQRFRDALLKVERLVCSALHPAAGGDDSEETTDA